MFAQGEMIAANLDFNGITQRREADQLDGSSDEKAHFHQARTAGRGDVDLCDAARGTGGQRAQWLAGTHQAAVR